MELQEALNTRRSCRAYTEQAVPREALEAIVAAAQVAPIGMAKFKSMHMSMVQDPELLRNIAEAGAAWGGRPAASVTYNVPALLVVSSEPGDPAIPAHPDDPLCGLNDMNTACMLENALLAATEQGLASVFLYAVTKGLNSREDLRERLHIPAGFVVRAAAAFGYAAKQPAERTDLAPIPTSWV